MGTTPAPTWSWAKPGPGTVHMCLASSAGLLGHDVLSVLGSASAPPPPPQAGPQVRSGCWRGGTMAWEGGGWTQCPSSGLQWPPAGSPTSSPLSPNLFCSFLSPFSLPVCTWLAESLAGGGCLLPLTAQRTAVGTPLCLPRGCGLKSVAPEVSGDPPGRPGLGPPGIPGIAVATGGRAVGHLL